MEWSATDHATWRRLYQRQDKCRAELAHPLFVQGLHALGIEGDAIPDLNKVNALLMRQTGWQGVFVEGLEGPARFFALLAERKFPVGSFIRDASDLNYTPAPDVFHDLYGHLPFFIDQEYGDFCERFGNVGMIANPTEMRELERLFWFGVEFPLVKTAAGRRIFGGGILSSYSESIYSMSSEPEVRAFDVDEIRHREFKIDVMQTTLYELNSPSQLYDSLCS
jgi:phenylalanine-4-hydroxylase